MVVVGHRISHTLPDGDPVTGKVVTQCVSARGHSVELTPQRSSNGEIPVASAGNVFTFRLTRPSLVFAS